jgi:hypothetical protein
MLYHVSTPTVSPGELWDADRTAEYLGTTKAVLAQERHKGVGLPYVRIGHRIRYRVTDILDYLDANTVRPGQD